MPSKRDMMKRKISSLWYHTEEALDIVAYLHVMFEKQHPDLALLLEAIGTTIMISQTGINDWVKAVWGYIPDNYESWKQ